MSRLLVPYGTSTELIGNVLQEREIAYNTTLDRFVMGDGVEAGGKPLAFLDEFLASEGADFVDVASATTTDLGAVASDKVRITGTTTITGFGTVAAGTKRTIRFAGALNLTYNATSLILPGNANIVTKADDCCTAYSLGSGNWVVTDFQYEDMPLRRVSSSQVSLYSNGGTVEALRIYDANSKFRIGTPTGINTAFPEFEFVADLGQPKLYTRTIFLADPGDTPDINLQAVGGDYTTYTAVFAYHMGGFLRGLHYDGTSTSPVSGIVAPTDGDVAGSYPYNGAAGQIAFPNMQTPTQANRGGGVLINSTPLNMAAVIQRIFVHPAGGTVFFGRSTWEDTGASYPWDTSSRNHWDRDALGPHNYSNVTPTGVLHVITSDRANLAALSMRKYNAQTTGFDLSYTETGDVFTIDRVVAGSRIRAIGIINGDGIIDLGHAADGGNRSVRITPVSSQVNYLELKGGTTGNQVEVLARGDDANIPLVVESKGTSGIFLRAGGINGLAVAQTASGVNYLQIDPNATGSSPLLSAVGSDTNIGFRIRPKGTGEIQLGSGLRTNYGASDVNYIDADGVATGNRPTISSKGSDTNVGLDVASKGTGIILIRPGGVTAIYAAYTASGVNYIEASAGSTGNPAALRAQGSDTNVDLRLTGQGTGVLRFGTHTALGGESVTGYITIKDDGGTSRKVAVVS